MKRLFLAAGVAALAIAAPASAKPGGDQGGGGDRGGKGGQAAHKHQGGGDAKAQRGGGEAKAQRGGGNRQAMRMQNRDNAKADRGDQARSGQKQRAQLAQKQERRVERAQKVDKKAFENRNRGFEQARKADRQELKDQRRFAQDRGKRFDRVIDRDVNRGDWDDRTRWANARGFDGCPPGLAAKKNGCLPPGQAKKLIGQRVSDVQRIAALGALPQSIRNLYADNDDHYYRYGGGYVYRVDRDNDLISSLIPLLAGGLLPGQAFPTNYNSGYNSGYVPNYFNAFYQDTPYVDYRYAYGNAYAVNPMTGLIQDVVPTYGYGYGVGQALPTGYGYYNVPYDYRNLYSNTASTNYWYAPGAIYQVDPQTQLISSVASLLAPGFNVGQQIPSGYNYYNVPMAYRDTYSDTPDAWYRYNNGNIYQVDPTTQLVTAIVASLLT